MILTITDIDNPVRLQNNIDNRCGKTKIGIRKFIYYNMQYNVKDCFIDQTKSGISERIRLAFPDGAYTFPEIKNKIEEKFEDLNIDINQNTGVASLNVPKENVIFFNNPLRDLLGFTANWFNAGVTKGEQHINLEISHMYIYLNELSTQNNLVDGAPSNILDVIQAPSVSFGEVTAIEFNHPIFKTLQNGEIHELKISILDKYKNKINFCDTPIIIVLEIQE